MSDSNLTQAGRGERRGVPGRDRADRRLPLRTERLRGGSKRPLRRWSVAELIVQSHARAEDAPGVRYAG